MANRPEPELEVNEQLVRALIAEQAPEFADLSLRLLDRGWDNTNWRLGDDYVVRLPHRLAAAGLVTAEQRWLPALARRIELPIPVPVFAGAPSAPLAYPCSWSIVPWFAGRDAAIEPLVDPAGAAVQLGRFFRQVHVPAPAEAPENPFRGGPIADREPDLLMRVGQLEDRIDRAAVLDVFAEAKAAPSPQSGSGSTATSTPET